MYLPNSKLFLIIIYVCGAVGMDIWKRKIPNNYIMGGLIFLLFIGEYKESLAQFFLIGVLILPLYSIHVLGAGDIKFLCVLAGGLTALFVIKVLIQALVLTAIATAILKIFFFIGKKKEKIENFPFTLPILLALISQICG